ncbi:ankyrin repeat-containing BDA1-like [Fagus crenata]
MCLVSDRLGMTHLHLATIKGRLGMLIKLVRLRPESTRVVFTSSGESVLHLCVKCYRLEALKLFVECVGEDDEFVNWRDSYVFTQLDLTRLKLITLLLPLRITSSSVDDDDDSAKP